MQWVLCADAGRRHNIGIYHGDRTGHLLIYCNDNIVAIDFDVHKNKSYAFFIDNELCNVTVEKGEDGFSYGLEIDKKTETPLNLARKEQHTIDKRNLLIGIGAFILFVSLFVILLYTIG